MNCDAAECKRPAVRFSDVAAHTFAGYGWFLAFHPECCPGALDGSRCRRDHPAGWEPADMDEWRATFLRDQEASGIVENAESLMRAAEVERAAVAEARPLRASVSWPGRTGWRDTTSRGRVVVGYAGGGFRTRRRVQWARALARELRPSYLAATLRSVSEAAFEQLHAEDLQAACPHPDLPDWRVDYPDGLSICVCGKVLRP